VTKMKLGIVGLGYVGTAVYEGLKDFHEINTFDIAKKSSCLDIEELTELSDYIFVSVPTPMNKKGQCDLSIVEEVIGKIDKRSNGKKVVILKSTSIPETTQNLQKKFPNITIIFNPEFLTEKNFIEDFKNQEFIILGGDKDKAGEVKYIYKIAFPNSKYYLTDSITAETVKYTINNFLALKVSFANEIYRLCEVLKIDYSDMINIASEDSRLGQSHWMVPGHDGSFGYGGSCFPKDVSALYAKMNELKLPSYIIQACLKRNIELDRPEKDWELLRGRAVSDNE
jgi:nucleotide sugar dehydrogenase